MTEQHALSRLIESVKEANAWTNADLERAARRRGHDVSRSNISRILTQPVKTVVPAQVRMFSDATGLPVEMVALAALRATGLSVDVDATDLLTVVRRDTDLPTETKEAIIAIVTPYKKRRRKPRPVDDPSSNVHRLNADEPYLLDEAARESTGEPYPGEGEDVGDYP